MNTKQPQTTNFTWGELAVLEAAKRGLEKAKSLGRKVDPKIFDAVAHRELEKLRENLP